MSNLQIPEEIAIRKDEIGKWFWMRLLLYSPLKEFLESKRSNETRQRLESLIVTIQRSSAMHNGEGIRWKELKKEMVGISTDEDRYKGKETGDFRRTRYEHETLFQNDLNRLLKIGLLIKDEKLEPTKRSKRNKEKENCYYRINHELISTLNDLPLPLTKEEELARIGAESLQKLERAKEIGIKAYLALGRSKEDFESEFHKRTVGPALWADADEANIIEEKISFIVGPTKPKSQQKR